MVHLIIKMVKKIFFVIILSIVALFLVSNSYYNGQEEKLQEIRNEENIEANALVQEELTQLTDYQEYNFQFAEGRVIPILEDLIGESGTLAFYLPNEKYIEVNSGESFGVAFALNNPNPSGENYFEWKFTPDLSNVQNCGTDGESWMGLGRESFGRIPKGWVDMSTIYFKFPEGISCTVKFNFLVTKDDEIYGTEVLEFRIK